MNDAVENKFILSHLWVAFGAFILACFMGVYQVLERSGFIEALTSPSVYFASVSTHGVLMAFVLTTFFIMGFGYYVASTSLKMPIWNKPLAWTGFSIALGGTVLAAIPLLIGKASVLYTFYPPLLAHVSFYIGATLLVVGSWFWCAIMVVMFYQWKKANPSQPVPLAMFATTANALLWLWTSAGVALEVLFQLIPLALGWMDTIDPGLARTLFAWTLHPIVYFWLIPAYTAFYVFVPKQAGGFLFSDEMARVAFIILVVFGLPIGFHHLYMDPEQASGWKLLHAFGTFVVSFPTLITGFTVIASLEIAGRLRGGKGLFGWIGTLPWTNPMTLSVILSLLMLIFGGFGGLVNASYAMNAMIHNTAWVPGHFHLIFGGTTIIMYFAIAYYFWPILTRKPLFSDSLALIQLWTWFIGMAIMTTPWHVLGLLGQPRRISSVAYNSLLTLSWDPYEFVMIFGGFVLLGSACLFIYNLAKTQLSSASAEFVQQVEYAEPIHAVESLPEYLNDFKLWNKVIAVLMFISFGVPILQFFFMDTFGSSGWGY
ncbi:b(o/a)3-type cytochrome-c oxidase subunit 1 [Methylicorpusculum sp.]|uniref:b(o/a)3-type cytochrome-c oxidase subunit 1 n=1 Tax=Methylicorpusculum sp. TaxID=2713644 RepID=UPI0027319E10|nr:b(o/a)3-type cytochrome-c oxidase subunit 1 [Methylicorpusculum sp.]MDP2179671.1 b(o/a)3-type cytochrome-c oxidase subunit 1 [Methylicorpusculum sp.]MDP3529070.1 b(o/a)3-type cytochrome-c oxidase subunit 1 [Methylicorpusculum sp.]MDZ4154528.1 b(o/a)3-type cytochrome-c oxidase subunit 1 [Methylicorpusculum sp.]